MLNAPLPHETASRAFVCLAKVIEVGADNLYRVSGGFENVTQGKATGTWAFLSLELLTELAPGDTVLVTGETIDACYIIGIVKRNSVIEVKADPLRVMSKNGAYAQTINERGKESIQVRDNLDNLVFEYDTEQQRATLTVAKGDLCLNALEGEIQLFSSNGINCRSLGDVKLESQSEIILQVPSAAATPDSALQLTAQRASLSAQAFDIKAKQASLLAEHTKVEGESLIATLARSKLVIERLETVAQRIFQRAVNIFSRVENLQQTQAGKVRTLVSEDYYLKAQHTDIQAEQDVKINGDKIHLG
jgi:dUTPase